MRKFKTTHIDEDLGGKQFSNQDHSNSLFYNCDCRRVNLHGTDLRNCAFPNSDFSYARIMGAHITLDCLTFQDVKLDKYSVFLFLDLITLADIDPEVRSNIVNVIGKSSYERMSAILRHVEPDNAGSFEGCKL